MRKLDIQNDGDVIAISHALLDYVGYSSDVNIDAMGLTLQEVLHDFVGSLNHSPDEQTLANRLDDTLEIAR